MPNRQDVEIEIILFCPLQKVMVLYCKVTSSKKELHLRIRRNTRWWIVANYYKEYTLMKQILEYKILLMLES